MKPDPAMSDKTLDIILALILVWCWTCQRALCTSGFKRIANSREGYNNGLSK